MPLKTLLTQAIVREAAVRLMFTPQARLFERHKVTSRAQVTEARDPPETGHSYCMGRDMCWRLYHRLSLPRL
jgi:hypothetical protein